MATTNKSASAKTTKNTATAKIVTDTAQEKAASVSSSSSNLVYIACGMPLGIKFDDVDNGNGGFKTLEFPGINHALAGLKSGILLPSGNAVLVSIDKNDWEDIKRKHGRERCFTSVPPLLLEVKNEAEFKARSKEDIAEMKTGVDPVSPKEAQVEKV